MRWVALRRATASGRLARETRSSRRAEAVAGAQRQPAGDGVGVISVVAGRAARDRAGTGQPIHDPEAARSTAAVIWERTTTPMTEQDPDRIALKGEGAHFHARLPPAPGRASAARATAGGRRGAASPGCALPSWSSPSGRRPRRGPASARPPRPPGRARSGSCRAGVAEVARSGRAGCPPRPQRGPARRSADRAPRWCAAGQRRRRSWTVKTIAPA